jgi:hypothetical protein
MMMGKVKVEEFREDILVVKIHAMRTGAIYSKERPGDGVIRLGPKWAGPETRSSRLMLICPSMALIASGPGESWGQHEGGHSTMSTRDSTAPDCMIASRRHSDA